MTFIVFLTQIINISGKIGNFRSITWSLTVFFVFLHIIFENKSEIGFLIPIWYRFINALRHQHSFRNGFILRNRTRPYKSADLFLIVILYQFQINEAGFLIEKLFKIRRALHRISDRCTCNTPTIYGFKTIAH